MENTTREEVAELIHLARTAKENAYQPYSEYAVGAVVVTVDGSRYTGCNIENITLDMCSHAERTAMRTAIADGHRDFKCIALSAEAENGPPPCGTCRQFLAEFCDDDFVIFSDNGEAGITEYTLGEIFPHAFRPESVSEATED
jgi:cytidine deaminase